MGRIRGKEQGCTYSTVWGASPPLSSGTGGQAGEDESVHIGLGFFFCRVYVDPRWQESGKGSRHRQQYLNNRKEIVDGGS